MIPARWLLGAVGGLAALIGAYFYGVGVGKDAIRADNLAAMEKARTAIEKARDAVDVLRARAAAREVERQTTVREIYRDVPTIIDRPVYRNICVDADGVQLLDRAVAAANGADRPGAPRDAAAPPGDAARR